MVFKKKLLSVLVAVMTIGVMQASIAVPATMAYTNATPSATSAQNQVLINSVMNGESVYWTQADQDKMNQRQAQFNAMVKPNDPSGPPSSATVSIGTGYGLYNDFLQDSNESTQPGVKDNYLILENPAGDTCGPIATHNCLTHFGSALNFTQLEPLIGYVKGSGVGWSSKIASGLNSQESTYYYTAFTYMGSSQSAWDSTMTDLAIATGREGVPTDVNTNGYLHQFGHNLGHFWVGCGYNNYYGTDSARYINYNDTSQEHSGTYWFSQPVSWFIGVCNIYGINA